VSCLDLLGSIKRELQRPDCRQDYEEAYSVALRIGCLHLAAVAAFNIGVAHLHVPELRDLTESEFWLRRSLGLYGDTDSQGQALCLGHLAEIATIRFEDLRLRKQPATEQTSLFQEALDLYNRVLRLLPDNALTWLAVTHEHMGNLFAKAFDVEDALLHFREALRYNEASDNRYAIAVTRENIARVLFAAGRDNDALAYAQRALSDYEALGNQSAASVVEIQAMIATIEKAIGEKE
jgi:tetratricopeptide (TPR) repeat protein